MEIRQTGISWASPAWGCLSIRRYHFFYEQRLIYIDISISYSISELLSLFETLDFEKNKEYI